MQSLRIAVLKCYICWDTHTLCVAFYISFLWKISAVNPLLNFCVHYLIRYQYQSEILVSIMDFHFDAYSTEFVSIWCHDLFCPYKLKWQEHKLLIHNLIMGHMLRNVRNITSTVPTPANKTLSNLMGLHTNISIST